MLRGKRAVITGGSEGFDLVRRCAYGLHERVYRWIFAHVRLKIFNTCSIITAESGIAKGYICDLTLPEYFSQFSSQLLTSSKPIDILILNAAQWLSGRLDDQPDTEIINAISSDLTGSILLTQAQLHGLRRSDNADIVSIISSCGLPNFTASVAHPAILASKHGLSGFTTKLAQQLSEENIRVTGLYPPDFEFTGLDTCVESQSRLDYNECHPPSMLNYQTPSEFAAGWRKGNSDSKGSDITK